MPNVQVIQRHAHLATAVRLEFVSGRDGQVAKAVLVAISNTRRGSGDARTEESTAIQWTVWGQQAEYAAEYLGKGSHVNIVGRIQNNNYRNNEGTDVYAMAFTAEEIDYLDSRADSEARRGPGAGTSAANDESAGGSDPSGGAGRGRKPRGRGRSNDAGA